MRTGEKKAILEWAKEYNMTEEDVEYVVFEEFGRSLEKLSFWKVRDFLKDIKDDYDY